MSLATKVNSTALSGGSYGGNWRGVANGSLKIRWNGNWQAASLVYVRWNGNWVDSGYRGKPANPVNVGIYGWDYSNVAIQWGAGGGGSPVASYEIVFTDPNGNWYPNMPISGLGGSPWGWWGINWDTRYRVFVRAKGTNGTYSDFVSLSGATGFGIGHPQQDNYGPVQHSRAWASEVQWNYRHRDELFGVYVGNDILLSGVNWQNLRTSHPIVTIGTNRTIYLYLNNADQAPINYYIAGSPQIESSGNYSSWGIGLNNWGNNAYWGIVPRESGWAVPNGPGYIVFADAVQLVGNQYYTTNDLISSIGATGNYYW